MPLPVLTTYRDAIEGLVLHVDGLPQEAEQGRAREAVQSAYQNLAGDHNWRYLTTHGRINLSDEYTTGTVTYVAATRVLTLTDGTWPSWARYGRLLIGTDTVIYKIAERTSDAVVTLEANFCPAADITTGTSFTLYRNVYPLPGDLRSLEAIHDERGFWSTSYLEPNEWLQQERQIARTGRPWWWSILGHADTLGSLALCFSSRIKKAQTFDFIYQRMPRRLKYDGFRHYSSQGDALIVDYKKGQTQCEFSGVILEEDVVGAVLRTAMGDQLNPGPPGGLGAVDRYAEQKIISSRDSPTLVTVYSPWEFERRSSHFAIADPVDLPEYLLDAFRRGCEYEMAIRQTPRKTAAAEALYRQARLNARRRNLLSPSPEMPTDWSPWAPTSWPSRIGTISGYWGTERWEAD